MEQKPNIPLPESVELEAFQLLNKTLTLLKPYLIALSAIERRAIPNISDKTQPFAEKTIAYCDTSPQFVPPFMDTEVLKSDMSFYKQLIPLFRIVKQLSNGLDDSAMKAGADCYTNGLNYYNSVKQASRIDVPGAKAIYEDLRKRFIKNRSEEVDSEE